MLCEDLSLGVIADDLDVDEAAQVQLLGPEHRHLVGKMRGTSMMCVGMSREVLKDVVEFSQLLVST
jgi:hypothetical protein